MTTVSSDRLQQPTQDKISVEYINECFTLGLLTGNVYWRERPTSHFSSPKFCALFNGRFAGRKVCDFGSRGYRLVRLTINGKRRQLFLHRLVWVLAKGAWPVHELDHKDTDHANNRIYNLREATHAQNRQNTRARRGSATGLKGVSVHRKGFTAYIQTNNYTTYLGKFRSPDLAHEAYRVAAKAQNGEFARFA
jgi:hypothetical protein